jgi:hypothetical protein
VLASASKKHPIQAGSQEINIVLPLALASGKDMKGILRGFSPI